MVQNGPNDHFGQTDLIPNWILAFARQKWSILVHFGLKNAILVHLGPPTALWPFLISGNVHQVEDDEEEVIDVGVAEESVDVEDLSAPKSRIAIR